MAVLLVLTHQGDQFAVVAAAVERGLVELLREVEQLAEVVAGAARELRREVALDDEPEDDSLAVTQALPLGVR